MNAKGSVRKLGPSQYAALTARGRVIGVFPTYGTARLVASGVLTPEQARG